MKARARHVCEASALRFGLVMVLALAGVGCSKAREAASRGTLETQALAAPPSDCPHAVCADNFFIDAAPATCTAGSPCSAALTLVATGDFHVNDEYPYRFQAELAPGVAFLGRDPNGGGTFSKSAGDWLKSDAKSGTMTVKFVAADPGAKAIAGILKLSVCSAQACLLEQRRVTANILTK
jgi:hypothetical protein